jgi:hypothetical protein
MAVVETLSLVSEQSTYRLSRAEAVAVVEIGQHAVLTALSVIPRRHCDGEARRGSSWRRGRARVDRSEKRERGGTRLSQLVESHLVESHRLSYLLLP